MSFTHLHVSTAFSAHYGVSWPDELAQTAAADGATALACTDRDGLYGTVKHLKACMDAGIDPIVGVNLAVYDDDGDHRTQVAGRVVVLAHGNNNGAGYRALCRLVSDAHARTSGKAGGVVPVAVTRAELASRTLDPTTLKPVLTVLIGPDSDVGRAMGGRRYLRPRTLFKEWMEAMPPGTIVAEIVSHLSPPGEPLSTAHAVRMLKLALEYNVPAILSNAVRYVAQDGAATADVLDSARTLKSLPELSELQPTGQGWLKTKERMHQVGKEIMGAAGLGASDLNKLIHNTEALADKCRMHPVLDMGWKKPVVPEASIIGITQDPMMELAQRCEAGITNRFPGIKGKSFERMRSRLDHELEIIGGLGFASYFLTVAEVSKMILEMGVRVTARGSGASSLVNYLIDISQVDPLRHDLVFERFLSGRRSTLPDIDIDVESAERHNVYRRIFDRFGAERVTLMSMQNGYRARGAVRDAGMALGMDEGEVGEIAKQLWRFSARKFREAMVEKPELREFAERVEAGRERGTRDENLQLDLLVDLTERLDRLPRHISMHPCGVILGDATLLDRTPVQPSGLGLPMSQFDKHDMDPMGMLKLDVLGVRMQSAMAFAVREVIRLHPGKAEVVKAGNHPVGPGGAGPDYIDEDGRIDLNAVPFDDEQTYELIRSTHTLGCFQIESPGQRELIGKMAPREFNDLIIDISLFRPGPMKSDMVRPFLEHRHGFAPEIYPHPDLKPVLQETHGVTVFHEQILKTFDVMTGCGLARADEFRRALGDETHEPGVETYFRKHAIKRYSPEVVDKVWGTLKAFGSFGFCKAHGAAFAVPTYQSAWLKAHHPEAFLAGLWEHDPGMYPKRLLVAEARRLGIPILPLDINRSLAEYRVERIEEGPDKGKLGIRLSLTGIYGLSGAELKRIVAGQPFDSLADLRARARVSKPNIKRLAQLGAFDHLHKDSGSTANRADLVQHLQALQASPAKKGVEIIEGQLSLPIGDVELRNLSPELPEPSTVDKVRAELDLMAVDVSEHLMESHRPLLDKLGVTTADKLLGLRNGSEVLVAGVRVATQTPPMRGGRRVVFISIDDGTGCVDSVFFHEAQEESGPLLFGTRLLLIRGTTRRTGPKGISLSASKAWDLSRPETLPFPEILPSGVVVSPELVHAGPLDGISRNLAITGLGS